MTEFEPLKISTAAKFGKVSFGDDDISLGGVKVERGENGMSLTDAENFCIAAQVKVSLFLGEDAANDVDGQMSFTEDEASIYQVSGEIDGYSVKIDSFSFSIKFDSEDVPPEAIIPFAKSKGRLVMEHMTVSG